MTFSTNERFIAIFPPSEQTSKDWPKNEYSRRQKHQDHAYKNPIYHAKYYNVNEELVSWRCHS